MPDNDRRNYTYDPEEQRMLQEARTLSGEQEGNSTPAEENMPRTEAQQIAGNIARIIVGQSDLPPHFPENFPSESQKNAAIATRVVAMRLTYQLPLSPERGKELTDALEREAAAHDPAVQEGIRLAVEGIMRLVENAR
ncbi:MAG: hypothetical protein WC698_00685 [Candidatus Peribacteraceae bacterium]